MLIHPQIRHSLYRKSCATFDKTHRGYEQELALDICVPRELSKTTTPGKLVRRFLTSSRSYSFSNSILTASHVPSTTGILTTVAAHPVLFVSSGFTSLSTASVLQWYIPMAAMDHQRKQFISIDEDSHFSLIPCLSFPSESQLSPLSCNWLIGCNNTLFIL